MKVKYVILFFQYTVLGKKKLPFADLSQQMLECIIAPVLKGSNHTITGSTFKVNFFKILLLLAVNVAESTKHHYSLCQLTLKFILVIGNKKKLYRARSGE